METDASGRRIGAILSQQSHPIAFFSQKLSSRMQQASTYHREMFAITQAVSKWRQYLLGRQFTILTDQQSLRNLTTQQTPEQQKWLTKLVGYDFWILYRPGKQNTAADALSHTSEAVLMTISVNSLAIEVDLKQLNQTNPELVPIQQALDLGNKKFDDYQCKEGILFYKRRIVIPSDSPLRHKLLLELHATAIGGHAGVTRTFHRFYLISFGKRCARMYKHLWLRVIYVNK